MRTRCFVWAIVLSVCVFVAGCGEEIAMGDGHRVIGTVTYSVTGVPLESVLVRVGGVYTPISQYRDSLWTDSRGQFTYDKSSDTTPRGTVSVCSEDGYRTKVVPGTRAYRERFFLRRATYYVLKVGLAPAPVTAR